MSSKMSLKMSMKMSFQMCLKTSLKMSMTMSLMMKSSLKKSLNKTQHEFHYCCEDHIVLTHCFCNIIVFFVKNINISNLWNVICCLLIWLLFYWGTYTSSLFFVWFGCLLFIYFLVSFYYHTVGIRGIQLCSLKLLLVWSLSWVCPSERGTTLYLLLI